MAWEDWEDEVLYGDAASDALFEMSFGRKAKVVVELLSEDCDVLRYVTFIGSIRDIRKGIDEVRNGGSWRVSSLKDMGKADLRDTHMDVVYDKHVW
jgi:hypothetical protein